ncbi:Uncharacterised protein [Staphylococcus aureus]|nr:Uncharacterised protein [Staphylococcus aureus]CPM91025.1 Uncharacterised protein [Staphylococcus aureus]SCT99631.1 Uncharacterised protein [Staphylococcus aureus]
MVNVENAIKIIVDVNTTLRPYLSPIIPNTTPPIGLNKNAMANAAKVNICRMSAFSTGEKKFAPMYAVVYA